MKTIAVTLIAIYILVVLAAWHPPEIGPVPVTVDPAPIPVSIEPAPPAPDIDPVEAY